MIDVVGTMFGNMEAGHVLPQPRSVSISLVRMTSMTDTATLQRNRDLILAEEQRFASLVTAQVIDKPKLAVWMILIPVFFIFYFWQLKRYADGRKTFAEEFLITRQRAFDEVLWAAELSHGPDVEKVVRASESGGDLLTGHIKVP